MQGTIDRRDDRPSKWRARYRGPDGRTHSKSFQRKVDAESWLAAQLSRMDRGEWIDPMAGRVTFDETAEDWLRRPVKESTREQNRHYLNSMVSPRIGHRAVKGIKPSDLQSMVDELVAEGKAAKTVRKAYSIAGAVLKRAVRDELIARSPARDIDLPADTRREPIYLDAPELFTVASSLGDFDGIGLLAGFGGLRFNEVAGLQVGDVERSTVHVRRGANEVGGRVLVTSPKTPKAVRDVVVSSYVIEALPLEDRVPEEFIYTDSTGGPLRRRNWMKRVWRPAVGNELNFHDLRHSHVAVLIKLGEHPKTIADRLGHESVRTVLDLYGGLFDEVSADVARKLETFSEMSHTRPKLTEKGVAK